MSEFDSPSIPDRLRYSDRERLERFRTLRHTAIEQAQRETAERIKNNPTPTTGEDEMGAFIEMLEPQVRDAVLMFREKGYATESSGFGGRQQSDKQTMTLNGKYTLGHETLNKLTALGVQIRTSAFRGHTLTHLRFQPKEADLVNITEQWNAIAHLLPPTGHRAFPAVSDRAVEFRAHYAKGSAYLHEWAEHFWSQPEEGTQPQEPPSQNN
jgi:hypothetical protein